MKKRGEDTEVIGYIVKLLVAFRWRILLLLLCIIVSSVISALLPYVNRKLIDDGLIVQNVGFIVRYSVLTFVLVILIQGIGVLETKHRSYVEHMIAFRLELDAIRKMFRLKLSFYNNNNYAQVMNTLKTDIGCITGICNRNTFYIITSLIRMMVGVIGLILIDWKLSIIVFVIAPLRYLFINFTAKKRERYYREYIKLDREYSAWQADTFAGIKEVKSYGLQVMKMRQFIKKQRELIVKGIQMSYLENTNYICENLFMEIISVLLYIIGGIMITNHSLTIGALFAFLTYSTYVSGPIFAIMNMRYVFAGILPSAKRYYEFLNMECETDEKIKKQELLKINEVKGIIEFQEVRFSYQEEKPILKNISFQIQAGEKVAILGKNGAGKTTIIQLIMRFLQPQSGKIRLDGIDIQTLGLNDYRKLFAIVSQEIYLFHTDIKENIILGEKKGEERFQQITKACGVDSFVEAFPNGYHTMVGDHGSKLSGGQRQKVAMARALMRDAKIIILDEATSNYDRKSEQEIFERIRENCKDRTMIIITHRLDILESMDKIIFMNDGIVEAVGNHERLIQECSLYKDMIHSTLNVKESDSI